MADVRVDIERLVGGLSERKGNGWRKELNIVAWNGDKAKYDIRMWDEDHERMSKGITLEAKEAKELYRLLKNEFKEEK